MKSILKRVVGIAFTTILALGMFSCNINVNIHEHEFATTYTSNETHHWFAATCEHSDQVKDKAEHSFGEWKVTTQPTEEAEGLKERECSVCGYKVEEVVAKLEHTHKFAATYSKDATYHWQAATCEHAEEVKDKAEHTFGEWIVTTQPTEDAEGAREKICSVCEYKVEDVIAKLDHVHVKGTFHEAVAGTCVKKAIVAYYDCKKTDCEIKLGADGNPLATIEGDFAPHVLGTKHDAVPGTCKAKATVEYYDCATEGCEAKLDADGNEVATTEGEFGPHALGTHHAAVAGTCKAKAVLEHYDCATEGCEVKLDKDLNVLTTTEGEFGPHVLGTHHDAVAGTCKTKAVLEHYDCATEGCTKQLDKDLNVLATTEGDFGSHALGTHRAAVAGTCKAKAVLEHYDCATEGCEVKLNADGNPLATTEGALL